MTDQIRQPLDCSFRPVLDALLEAQALVCASKGVLLTRVRLPPAAAILAMQQAGRDILVRARGDRCEWPEGAHVALVSPIAPLAIIPTPSAESGDLVVLESADGQSFTVRVCLV